MRILLCKFCEYATKLENGRHSLLGIFDDIRTAQLPVDHPVFYMVFQVEFEREECGQAFDIGVRFVAPNNTEIFRSDLKTEVPPRPPQDQMLLFFFAPISGVKLTQTGLHRIIISANGDTIHTEALPVTIPAPVPSR